MNLMQQVTPDEVLTAIKDMPKEKAPRVEGFHIDFFTICWEEVNEDRVDIVLHFFTTSEMDKAINCTVVTLVPKLLAPTYVKDYMPIAYCTILYKIITKLLVGRCKGVISGLIGDSQSNFY